MPAAASRLASPLPFRFCGLTPAAICCRRSAAAMRAANREAVKDYRRSAAAMQEANREAVKARSCGREPAGAVRTAPGAAKWRQQLTNSPFNQTSTGQARPFLRTGGLGINRPPLVNWLATRIEAACETRTFRVAWAAMRGSTARVTSFAGARGPRGSALPGAAEWAGGSCAAFGVSGRIMRTILQPRITRMKRMETMC